MTPRQKEIIRKTFLQLHTKEEIVADLLYKKFFELEPKSQALFRGDMQEQKRRLMRMLVIAVEHLDNPAELQPILFNLGQIHHSFGIEGHQFTSFGEALDFTIKTILKNDCTAEVEEAWKAVYLNLAATMHNHPHNENVQLPHN